MNIGKFMDNKKKNVYLRLVFDGIIICHIILFGIMIFMPCGKVEAIYILAEILVLCVFKYYFEKQNRLWREFLRNKDLNSLEKILFFYAAEEKKAFNYFLCEKSNEEKKDMLLASKKEAEVLALQNQINPHFLYNTLETIRSDAILNGARNAGTMAEALATFFRYTISNLDYLVQVSDELENVQNYFTIQHYRFGNKINIQFLYDKNDKEILKLYMPKLILQPIVENAIYHGIEQKLGSGQVLVSINYTKQNLDIVISDDGIGIKESKLTDINYYLSIDTKTLEQENRKKQGGIAIRNVNQRIKLLFGETYGIHLNSIYGIGTDVYIKLPVLFKPNELINQSERLKEENIGG